MKELLAGVLFIIVLGFAAFLYRNVMQLPRVPAPSAPAPAAP